jgi:dUTPase
LVETDLRIKVPNGTYGRIAPRSGLALYRMINVLGEYKFIYQSNYLHYKELKQKFYFLPLGGVIDADYRGNVGVILMNHGSDTFFIERGDRVAQLILEKISYANLVEVEVSFVLEC